MSFPKYPKYKDSGFQWLGDIPSHWETMRLATVCDFQSGKAHEPFIQDVGEFICVNSRFVSTEGESRKFCTENLSPTKRADILMVMSDLPNGRALAKAFFVDSDEPYAVNQRVCIIRAQEKANARFLYFQLNRSPLFLRHDDGVNQTHLSNATFTKFPTLVPPLPEQHAIATFLDAETSKIDALIAEQRRLIELLKEKRQAVISHAVTKGLNPDAPMKASGIEWLGDVPEHWGVAKVKSGITKIGVGWSPQCHSEPASDDEWGVVKVGCCNKFDLNEAEQKRLPAEIEPVVEYEIHDGDILMSRGNTLDLVGMAAFVQNVRSRLLLCDLVYRFRAKEDAFDPAFLVHSLRSKNVRSQIECNAVGSSATMKKVSQELVRNLFVCQPPLKEQQDISKQLATMSGAFDSLESEATHAIDLLQEHRTALISAAVTGKIDVRDMSRGGAENAEKTK